MAKGEKENPSEWHLSRRRGPDPSKTLKRGRKPTKRHKDQYQAMVFLALLWQPRIITMHRKATADQYSSLILRYLWALHLLIEANEGKPVYWKDIGDAANPGGSTHGYTRGALTMLTNEGFIYRPLRGNKGPKTRTLSYLLSPRGQAYVNSWLRHAQAFADALDEAAHQLTASDKNIVPLFMAAQKFITKVR
jgi:hypothetical protein